MEGIIELKNVSFSAQQKTLVSDITISYEPGKITALVGPSGEGKSTVMKLSAGLLPPDTGVVLYKGKEIAEMERAETLEFRREAAVVFQDSALWANQSLFHNLELPLRIHFPDMSRKEREKRITEVVAEVGYKRDMIVRPAQLSMGEQKLLAFARALICQPNLLFLDEWTESLDDNAARRLINIVKKRHSEGSTIILVSHDIRIICDLADIVVMIMQGKIHLTLTREQINNDDDLRGLIEKGIAA